MNFTVTSVQEPTISPQKTNQSIAQINKNLDKYKNKFNRLTLKCKTVMPSYAITVVIKEKII